MKRKLNRRRHINESAKLDYTIDIDKAGMADFIEGVANYIADVLDTDGFGIESYHGMTIGKLDGKVLKISVATGFAGETPYGPSQDEDELEEPIEDYDISVSVETYEGENEDGEEDEEDYIGSFPIDYHNDGRASDSTSINKAIDKIIKAVESFAKTGKKESNENWK